MKKLSWDNYFDRTLSVGIQFELARNAIFTFTKTPEAIKKYSEKEFNDLKEMLKEHFDESGKSPADHWVFGKEGFGEYLKGVQSVVPKQLEKFTNSLNQSELILRVSLFEIFMKDIHRQALGEKPSLIKADRKIPIGRVLSLGFKKVIEEEIEREVNSLDRVSVEDKARYFKEKLGIDWFGGHAVPLLKHVIEVRNSILHEEPERIVNEILDLGLATMMCIAIPFASVAQAAVLYPKSFMMIKGMKKSEVRKLMRLNGQHKNHLDNKKDASVNK